MIDSRTLNTDSYRSASLVCGLTEGCVSVRLCVCVRRCWWRDGQGGSRRVVTDIPEICQVDLALLLQCVAVP